jgi:hypothetical protein
VVRSDGRIEWHGDSFVKSKGEASARLDLAKLSDLRAAFAEAKWSELKEHYDCMEATDHSRAAVSLEQDGKTKRVTHYQGCFSDPGTKVMRRLEEKIDQIAGTARWIGTDEERDKLRGAGKLR